MERTEGGRSKGEGSSMHAELLDDGLGGAGNEAGATADVVVGAEGEADGENTALHASLIGRRSTRLSG